MTSTGTPPRNSRWPAALGAALICAGALAAYWGSFSGPFVFDDLTTIRDNPTIRRIWPPWQALLPPPGQGLTSNGRPLVNLSLAANYAISGNGVWSYHAFNFSIHVLAALTLFGVARRTLRRLGLDRPLLPALAVALIWAVHPLQTESVTYIVQRAESLMGLFFLLTLYCFIRGAEAEDGPAAVPRPVLRWHFLCFLACLAGMASKEVMVSAPLIVLLYDRTFVSGSFRESWRRRRAVHLALLSTWIVLGCEMAATGNRGATAGFGTAVGWWPYALTQFTAIVRYLRLCFWPNPLVFDYGAVLVTGAGQVLPCAAVVLILAAGTAFALCGRGLTRRALGFAGAWFFAILAPSSSVVPVATQVMAEHRMYLPLAAVVVVVVAGACRLAERAGRRREVGFLLLASFLSLATALGWLTVRRNRDYRSERAVWASAAAGYPGNPRSHSNLGYVLNGLGDPRAALAEFQAALTIDPDCCDALNNMGGSYFQLGDIPRSIELYRRALGINPAMASAHYNLGNSLVRTGQVAQGMAEYRESLSLDDSSPEAHYNYATSLAQLGRLKEALPEFAEALRLRPDYAEARNNLATALLQSGRVDDALEQYRQVLALNPGSATAHFNLANILVQKGSLAEATAHYHRALEINPAYAKAHCNLGGALARLDRLPEAAAEFREALRLNPDLLEARNNLERVEAYLRVSR